MRAKARDYAQRQLRNLQDRMRFALEREWNDMADTCLLLGYDYTEEYMAFLARAIELGVIEVVAAVPGRTVYRARAPHTWRTARTVMALAKP